MQTYLSAEPSDFRDATLDNSARQRMVAAEMMFIREQPMEAQC